MAIRWVGSAWRENLRTGFPQDHRVYADFRQRQYPDMGAGAPTFSLVTAADNVPGSHNMTGGRGNYLIDMASTFSIDMLIYPTFAYNTADDQRLIGWYADATHYWRIYYQASVDKFRIIWYDGGTVREMLSRQFDDGSSYTNINQWLRITLRQDLTSNATTGSVLYVNGTADDSSWSGTKDVKTSNLPVFTIRGLAAATGDYKISYLRYFPSYLVSAEDVANNEKDVKNEEIYWPLNGHPTGHTRCNITSRVKEVNLQRTVESPFGNANSNECIVRLMSPEGQFADDQYAAYDASAEIYNGTVAQKYMQYRCGLEVEHWYGGTYEPEFVGRVDEDRFKRRSGIGELSMVTVRATDAVDDMRRRTLEDGFSMEDYSLSASASAGTSVLHTILTRASQGTWRNYLANSSWENTTVGNSWVCIGSGGAVVRAAGGLIGSYQGNLTSGTEVGVMMQTVTFAADRKLNVGASYDFSVYVKASATASVNAMLTELTAALTSLTVTTTTTSVTGGAGWQRLEVTAPITTTVTSVLRVSMTTPTATMVAYDCAMLVEGSVAPDWFALNDNDGIAGTVNADSADAVSYQTIGSDTDDIAIVHPWAVVDEDTSLWTYMRDIADATAAYYMGLDAAGTLRFRSPLTATFAVPTALFTVSHIQHIDSMMDVAGANKVIVHGDYIVKSSAITVVWQATDANSWPTEAGSAPNSRALMYTVAAGGQWPPPSVYGEYWADYQEGAGTSGKDPNANPIL